MSLEQTKDKLSECYKKNQSVLLYGKDDNNRRLSLAKNVHRKNKGVLDIVEYIGDKKNTNRKAFMKEIIGQFHEALRYEYKKKERKIEINYHEMAQEILSQRKYGIDDNHNLIDMENKVQKHFKSTKKTWNEINCKSMNVAQVNDKLFGADILHNILILYDFPVQICGRRLFDLNGTLFVDNLSCNPANKEDFKFYIKLADELKKGKVTVDWLVAYTKDPEDFPDDFVEQFEPIKLDGVIKKPKAKKKEIDNFDDVKLEMTVDSRDTPLFDALVSAHNIAKEKLPIEDRFIEPLHLLAKTVKEGGSDGWVYNKDLKNKYSKEGTNTIKYNIINAFKKVIGTRAEGIISIKHGSAKKLMIPKKNIKFKSIK